MITFFGATDIGLVRPNNQDKFDFVTLSETLGFAVLCDGMGGQNGGSVASDIATRFVCDTLRRDLTEQMGEVALRHLLDSVVAGANIQVFDAAQADENLHGMGTTLIIAVFDRDRLYISYVGDSRVYSATPTQETQLTKDHTVVQMLVDIGEISEQDAQIHPKRHYITKAVGVAPVLQPDFIVHSLQPDELVLLCSDGLYHYLPSGSLYALLHRCMEEQSATSLISLAKDGGGSDNITVIVASSHE